MDPRDRLRPIPAGAACTACGAPVPTSEIRILARRDDVAFVELACRSCGSEALALLIAGTDPDAGPVLDLAADAGDPSEGELDGTSISALDASILGAHLDAWQGDLVGWLDAVDPRSGQSRGPGADG
jgi:hypothetical protein